MKIQELLQKLKNSKEFKDYKEKNPNAYFCAGFFVLDLDTGSEQIQFDYCASEEDIITFYVEEDIKAKQAEAIGGKMPSKINEEINTDLDKIKEIANSQAKKFGIRLNKIIIILQIIEGKQVYSLNCMAGLKILKIRIDAASGEVLKSDLVSLFELGKK